MVDEKVYGVLLDIRAFLQRIAIAQEQRVALLRTHQERMVAEYNELKGIVEKQDEARETLKQANVLIG